MASGGGASNDWVVFQQPNLPNLAFPVMEEIRRQGKLCDITIKVDDLSLSAHRIVLASTIPYFHAMLTYDMMESKQKDITIKGIDPGAMETLVHFAYSGKLTIHPDNVHSLMVGASYLQMGKVRDACADYLKNRLDPCNVLGTRNFAETLGCTSLVEAADAYLERHFGEVVQQEEFFSLNPSELQDLISRDGLHVSSEEQVFEAVMRWIKNDADLRTGHLPVLLTKVRMPLLSPAYLTDKVATEELIRGSHRCRDLLDEAKDYHLLPERRPLLQSFRVRPRCGTDIFGLLYAVGGLTKTGDSVCTVEVYDPIAGVWKAAEAMSMLRSRVGVAVLKNRLFAIGGYNGSERLNAVEVYDPLGRIWSRVSPMRFKRSAVGAAALGEKLYVCGGYDGVTSLNTVECYDAERDRWSGVDSMLKHRSAAGVVAFEGFIYALGGHDGLSIFDSVERYDPETGKWSLATPMLSKRCRLGVAVLGGKLYACGGYDGSCFLRSVEVYDPQHNRWSYVAPMNVTRSRVALAANAGKLWAVGGYDGEANLSSVEVYDPKRDEWTMAPPMCAHEGGVGLGVIPRN